MSVDYAAGLSDYDDLGVCGLEEILDKPELVKEKVRSLVGLLQHYKGSCVVHAGAGLSTSAGIPDFRGKRGVWTRKLQGEALEQDDKTTVIKQEDTKFKPFDETIPTISHLILGELCRSGFIRHIISQNVDGLFLKSNLSRDFISELHGNFYLDECTRCRSRFIRSTASKTMRLQKSAIKCPSIFGGNKDKRCNGHLRDTILDWESPIPYNELRRAQCEAKQAKLHICIGTSMQLRPSKDLVCNPSSRNKQSKLVVINLQPTQLDTRASLVINYYADEVMKMVADELDLSLPEYDSASDPTKRPETIGTCWKRHD